MTIASVAYISASTNRHNHAADVSSESLIAFGSSKLVALWDTSDSNDRGVSETLPGHEGLVTCVLFIENTLLLSADDKGVLKLWRKSEGAGSQWECVRSLQAHTKSISAVNILEDCLVTGGSDSILKAWKLSGDDAQELQSISLRGRYPLSLALAKLPLSKATILAVASTDRNVQILTRSDGTFVRSAVLSGHEDWVRSLSFRVPTSDTDPLILASGSQDGTIRLWNVETFSKDLKHQTQSGESKLDPLSDDLLDEFEASLGDVGDNEEGGRQISLKRHILSVKSDQGTTQQFSVTFDALLIGHEAGVTSLSWRPNTTSTSTPTLLSTSTDSSLILWSPSSVIASSSAQDPESSIWINRQRFGDVGGQRLGGFVGGLWSRHATEAMAWGWAGGWRRWRCISDAADEIWTEIGAISGHNGPVKGIDWSPRGEYLISAGVDQTSRVHGAIRIKDSTAKSWHELSRPQVHGYDLVDVAFLDPFKFVSISDEKVARVFEAPRGFVHVVKGLGVSETTSDESERPVGASVPPLGLSNKALNGASDQTPAVNEDKDSVRRPFEGELASMTLWPEIEKVFGHGYESISLAVSSSKRYVATACKATTAEHAVVRVYHTETWQLVGQPLEGHSLTVTRIAFSPDDRYVLSVSRDRTWRLFELHDEKGFIPIAADKSHARIIWDCAWAHEGDVFATASRDKTVKIWSINNQESGKKWKPVISIKLDEAATAVAIFRRNSDGVRRIAIGLENGEILIYTNSNTSISTWEWELSIDSRLAHVDHIHQLQWRSSDEAAAMELATCSEDGTLKVLIVHVGED